MIDIDGSGEERIAWAARHMPVLREISRELAAGHKIASLRIGVALVLEPKTANLVLALREAGAEVLVRCDAASTDQEVARALRDRGFPVFADRTADAAEDLRLAREFLAAGMDILIDDGAEHIRLAHREFPELVDQMLGAAEETTSGVGPLRAMQEAGALRIPVIAVNDSPVKSQSDNLYGTGQSCVMAFLDLTNLQLAGRRVAVVGYGWVGMGIARVATALGARVVVSEIDPVRALRALHDGHEVTAFRDAAAYAEVVFACTGMAAAVTPEHMEALPEGAIVCTAGGGPFELPMDYLRGLGNGRSVRPAVTAYTTRSGRTVHVLSDGECVNCADAEGNPIEVMDLSLSLQALAVAQLAREGRTLRVGVHELPREAEQRIARIRLEHAGASLETLSEGQRSAIHSW